MSGISLGFSCFNTLEIIRNEIKFLANGVFKGFISRPRLPGHPAALYLPLFDINSRRITTYIQPVINWCNQENTKLIIIELDSDNSDEVVLPVNSANELRNQFRNTLKKYTNYCELQLVEFQKMLKVFMYLNSWLIK